MSVIQKFLYLIFLFLPVCSLSQQYNFRNFTVRDGVAQSQVYALLQDHRGYLWMGTRGGGITRFDGLQFVTLTERATYLSPLTPWDEPTREAVRAQMAAIYELFLQRVAQGRNLPVDDIRKIAEGRIWSGVQGLEHRLIDEYGGLSEAIAIARKQAGLDDTAEVRIEAGGETLFDVLAIDEDEDQPESIQRALARLRALPPSPLAGIIGPLRPYAESISPLLTREKILTALPFAIVF